MSECIASNEWIFHSVTGRGLRHEKRKMKCQDQVGMMAQKEKIAVTLLDGKGDTDVNTKATKKLAELMNQFMILFFEKISSDKADIVKYNVMLQVQRILDAMSDQFQVDRKELSSTVVAFCIDAEKKTFCAIHLGDGFIATRNQKGKISVLSYPTNGKRINETVLSTTEQALKYIKVYRGEINDVQEVLLASDGIYECPLSVKELEECFVNVKKHDIMKQKMDDCSMILLEKAKGIQGEM